MTYLYLQSIRGEIIGYGSAPPVVLGEGVEVTLHGMTDGAQPDPLLHKIDETTGELCDLTPAERAIVAAPRPWEVRIAISGELTRTDQMFAADRPIEPAQQSLWKRYRQALRDLSKPQDETGRRLTPVEMVEQWPACPDGADPVAVLRARIESGNR